MQTGSLPAALTSFPVTGPPRDDARVRRVATRFALTPMEVADLVNTPVDELRNRDRYLAPGNTQVPTENFPRHPIGTAKIASFNTDPGEAYVDVLREFDPRDLIPTEPEDDIRRRSPSYRLYVEWFREGREPPPIDVVESERGDGKLLSTNRRRVLAAQEAGVGRILGWYGPQNRETTLPLKYKDVLAAFAEAQAALQWISENLDEAARDHAASVARNGLPGWAAKAAAYFAAGALGHDLDMPSPTNEDDAYGNMARDAHAAGMEFAENWQGGPAKVPPSDDLAL